MAENRVVCLNCMDGRTQLPVIDWITKTHGADYVDMITEAGIDGYVANEANSINDINRKIQISIDKNHASMIFVVGHYDCKGNPVSDDEHKSHVQQAVERLKKEFSNIPVEGLWVNESWNIESI